MSWFTTDTEIEIPTHCPLCHKFMGKDVMQYIMPDGSVIDVHCWHLVQLEIIRGLNELPDMIVQLRKVWREIKSWRQFLTVSYWAQERKRLRRVAEHHTDENPIIVVEGEPQDAA